MRMQSFFTFMGLLTCMQKYTCLFCLHEVTRRIDEHSSFPNMVLIFLHLSSVASFTAHICCKTLTVLFLSKYSRGTISTPTISALLLLLLSLLFLYINMPSDIKNCFFSFSSNSTVIIPFLNSVTSGLWLFVTVKYPSIPGKEALLIT